MQNRYWKQQHIYPDRDEWNPDSRSEQFFHYSGLLDSDYNPDYTQSNKSQECFGHCHDNINVYWGVRPVCECFLYRIRSKRQLFTLACERARERQHSYHFEFVNQRQQHWRWDLHDYRHRNL